MPRQATKADPQKQLMIKVKACQRLIKEAAYYEKETKENEERLQKMKDEQKDPYDIKKFEEVLGESQMMIPESIGRRDKALDDLRDFVSVLEKDEAENNDLMTCEWMVEAKKLAPSEKKTADEGEDVAITAVDGLAEGEAF
ncbi:tubulin-specific chaperone A [Skeletonema marinoi]|uniref:Tubulin-specific chaperone A n=1 Tax=Skeletonema marinoi TaxID=267567 RepID=A0AAD8Y169_9STRA|nr:tubulin-specific chaperone A [Skeletonema marinoi]